ncbi:polyphosphate kinase 1, partial [Gilvibacter sp.]|uniref:polyphosphate kinase 1 n=1 Tax=Gilvibacter sp. TaxID=2729997 RepID=UPI003F4A2180
MKDLINRDISWLYFNNRVLKEAADIDVPLYERFKFLAIFSSNLDEFFRVRVSRLRQLKHVKKKHRKSLGVRPNKTLKEVLKIVDQQQNEFGRIYKNLLKVLPSHGIHLVNPKKLTPEQAVFTKNYFKQELLHQLRWTNANQDARSFLRDGFQYLFIIFKGEVQVGFIELPTDEISRFLELPSKDGLSLIYLEDVIKMYLQDIYPDQRVKNVYQIKISRDAELYLDQSLEPELVAQIKDSLNNRQTGQPTRLLYDNSMNKADRKLLREHLDLNKIDLIPGGKRHNFSDFFALPMPKTVQRLSYLPMPPLKHPQLEINDNLFHAIAEKDRVLHFPYQQFDYVSALVEQATVDPAVTQIRISLYRTAKVSRLTTALLQAVENGKKVHIFIEAQARFDEQNNLNWGSTFEQAGAFVSYSIRDIKVHSKIMMISRNEGDQIKNYGYIGTGNFNAKTAKVYCDHALLTANELITDDLQQVFDIIERKIERPKLKALLVSPFTTRSGFETLIQNEIDAALEGKKAKITAKMNSLEDPQMIQWLYKASRAGVKIRLIVRGFCR